MSVKILSGLLRKANSFYMVFLSVYSIFSLSKLPHIAMLATYFNILMGVVTCWSLVQQAPPRSVFATLHFFSPRSGGDKLLCAVMAFCRHVPWPVAQFHLTYLYNILLRDEGEKWCNYELQVVSLFFNLEGIGVAFPECLRLTVFFSDEWIAVCFHNAVAGKRKRGGKGITGTKRIFRRPSFFEGVITAWP